MTTTAIIKEINKLPLTEKLLLVEKNLKGIRHEMEQALEHAVSSMYNEYKTNKELVAFTKIDAESFYEAR
ncbi:MAG: hypothetical protein K0Q79_3449 [Flavipsychrobacter sp.]|jgi:hypothetical protein|nr:hypothetical protein [Flavipsychrobacter sp.]